MKKTIYYVVVVLLLLSCKRTALEESLILAGENRKELEAVLRHYSCDTLKYKAAVFLIENMQGKYSLVGEALDSFYVRVDSAYEDKDNDFLNYRRFLGRSVKNIDWQGLEKKYDLKCITSEYLIKNIDDAFELRDSRWCRDLSFEDFCEYILPYRVGNEELEYWRDDYKMTFGHVFENTDLQADSALWVLCDSLSKMYVAHNYVYPSGFPTQKPSMLRKIIVGSCDDYANLFVLIGRTFGIPVARDFTPQWANFHSSHDWASVLVGDTAYSFALGDGTRLGQHLSMFEDHIMTKVFRRSYHRLVSSIEEAPYNLDFEHIKDVTEQFYATQDLTIVNLYSSLSKNVSLAVFDNKGWTPIDCAIKRGDSVTFSNVRQCKAVYLPVYSSGNKSLPAQSPFILCENGVVRYLIPDHEKSIRVVLTRKYLDTRARYFTKTIVGGMFQLSRDLSFSNPKIVNIPDSIGLNYQTIMMDDSLAEYRYFRYIPQKGQVGEVAEIEIYNVKGDTICGKVIANYRPHRSVAPEKAFDGQTLSFASCPDTCWFGVDFGEMRNIARIDYLPHTDDNFIRDGEEYELWYWDKDDWVSLGKQIGSRTTQELVYDGVPSNALLLLRNNTKGKEERIFMYEDGNQIWW